MVHLRSNALAKTILKICDVVRYNCETFRARTDLLHVDAVAGAAEYQTCLHRLGKAFGLERDFFLVLAREVDEMVVLGTNKERNGCFVETPALAIPFLDGVQSAFAGEIKHKEDRNGVIADEWQHIDELALATKIPDGECDLRVAN